MRAESQGEGDPLKRRFEGVAEVEPGGGSTSAPELSSAHVSPKMIPDGWAPGSGNGRKSLR